MKQKRGHKSKECLPKVIPCGGFKNFEDFDERKEAAAYIQIKRCVVTCDNDEVVRKITEPATGGEFLIICANLTLVVVICFDFTYSMKTRLPMNHYEFVMSSAVIVYSFVNTYYLNTEIFLINFFLSGYYFILLL